MNWFKEASLKDLEGKIKEILKSNRFIISLAEYYHVPLKDIDTDLKIEICDLHGKFAEGNGKLIRIDKKLLHKDFFKQNFHFVIHEFFHWLKRRSEEMFYFNDPEEVQSFVLQMTWQFIQGKKEKEVIKTIYPIVKNHFKDDCHFKSVFKEMLRKAKDLYRIYREGGEIAI